MDAGAYAASLGGLLTGSSLVAIFTIMLVKEIGVPVPVPADLLIIGAGVQAALGRYSVPELALTLAVAVFIGCSVQFLIVRGFGRRVVYRLGRFVGLTPGRLDLLTSQLERRGPVAVFAGLNLPGVRKGTIIAAGLGGMRYRAFAPAMLLGSAVYYGWHIALGYVVGPAAAGLLAGMSLPLVLVLAALAIVGLVGWLVLRRWRRARAARPVPPAALPADLPAFQSWTEAACPACLAVASLQVLRGPLGLAAAVAD
jgi:membrane-associated protein